MKISRIRLCVTLAAGALAGCGGGLPCPDCAPSPAKIEISDGSVFVPTLRAEWNLSRLKAAPSEPQSGHAIEVNAFSASGGDTQSIDAGHGPVVLGGQSLPTPATLQNDFRFSYYDVSYRWRQFFHEGSVGFEALGGAAFTDLGIKVSSPSQQASENIYSAVFSGGVGLVWRMRPGTSLQLRGKVFGSNDASGGFAETYLVQALGRNAAVRAGYSVWSIEWDRGGDKSAISLDFWGPSLGFELDF